jgi:hypothetical protein
LGFKLNLCEKCFDCNLRPEKWTLNLLEKQEFKVEALEEFYDHVSTTGGLQVADFQNKLESLFEMCRSNEDLMSYRLGRAPWKKLSNEIVPVSEFLKLKSIKSCKIHFPLKNNIPDCWLQYSDGTRQGIGVTIERGKERFLLAKELNNDGVGRGHFEMQDDASSWKENVENASSTRTLITSDQALEAKKR